eukprot:PhF_6_TR7959/c1_g1_i2/m.12055
MWKRATDKKCFANKILIHFIPQKKSKENYNMEFPDTHHKMSKKIAQLTKVIYLLNTRNDESEAMLKSVVDQYEAEIAEVVSDAKNKMYQLSKISEEKSIQVRSVKEALAALSQQKESEQADAVRRFEQFKVNAARNEEKITKAAEEKVAALAREVASMKESFQLHTKSALDNASATDKQWRDQLDELRAKKDKEVEGLVVEYNERYKAMLARQLQEREEEKTQLDAEWGKKLSAMEDKFKAEKKRADEMTAKAKALEEIHQGDLKRIQEMTSQMAQLNEEISRLRDKESVLNTSVASTLRQLSAAEEMANALKGKSSQLDNELNSVEGQKRALLSQLANIQSQFDALMNEQSSLKMKNQELERNAQSSIEELEGGRRSLQDNVTTLQAQCAQLRSQLDTEQRTTADLRDKEAKLKAELAGLEKEMERLKREHAVALDTLRAEHNTALQRS